MKTNLTNKKKLAEMIVKAVKEQQQSLEKDLFEKKEGWNTMISIFEGIAWAIIGLLAGIVLGDPDKKKYFK